MRSDANVKGTVDSYAHFDPPPYYTKKPIRSKILILHGANDSIAPAAELQRFEKELDEANVDWQTHLYGNTMHAFATPGAHDPAIGILYNPVSAARTWAATQNFLSEIFH